METTGGVGRGICLGCGNPAKRECQHFRCRTCCKRGGFECATHLKSSWVSTTERRERRLEQLRGEILKRQREDHQTNEGSCGGEILGVDTSGSGSEISSGFPAEVNCQAQLRRVTVSNMGDSGAQYAYQTDLNIGGRIFSGVLYDAAASATVAAGDSATTAASNVANAVVPSKVESPFFDETCYDM